MVKWLKDWVPVILFTGILMVGCVCTIQHTHNYKVKYAAEHNCRWDYNDMCYTREERPWLFRDKTDD